ncbi:MAG TPA: hypothetical protein VF631_13655, partial [Allosphingosinicella sp.]|uniref:hypothetical protein n=1 Tax=Allosphingosinicella sp. TaxID=2823234 RepID=UPI002F293DB8
GAVSAASEADDILSLKLSVKDCARSANPSSHECKDARAVEANLQTRYAYCKIGNRLHREDASTGECKPDEPVEL